jgi:hypothetical protein
MSSAQRPESSNGSFPVRATRSLTGEAPGSRDCMTLHVWCRSGDFSGAPLEDREPNYGNMQVFSCQVCDVNIRRLAGEKKERRRSHRVERPPCTVAEQPWLSLSLTKHFSKTDPRPIQDHPKLRSHDSHVA